MDLLYALRTTLVVVAVFEGCSGVASAVADITSPGKPTFPENAASVRVSEAPGADWLDFVSPFRSDLARNEALILAFQTIKLGKSSVAFTTENERIRSRVKRTLSVSPYNPELWLALAMLDAQRDPDSPETAEALKLAYFTAPNDAGLMAARLDTAASSNALADADLRDLVQGDLLLMTTRSPDMKGAVVATHRRASPRGKAFIEEFVRKLAPALLSQLSK